MIVGNGRVLALQFKAFNCHAINILCHRNKHGSVARPRREANLCLGNPITSCARLADVRAEQSEPLLVDVYLLFVNACRYNDRVASAGGINGGLDRGVAAIANQQEFAAAGSIHNLNAAQEIGAFRTTGYHLPARLVARSRSINVRHSRDGAPSQRGGVDGGIGAGAASEGVVAVAAAEDVVAAVPIDRVVSAETVQRVRTVSAIELVSPGRCIEEVGVGGADQLISSERAGGVVLNEHLGKAAAAGQIEGVVFDVRAIPASAQSAASRGDAAEHVVGDRRV